MNIFRGGSARAWALAAVLAAIAAGAAWAGARHLRRDRIEHRLLAVYPQQVLADPRLVRFAVAQARPLFAEHCAVCHGRDMRGNPAIGAPNLTDRVWLYGSGTVYDIERTLLYGIRSGRSKARNVTDMPGYGVRGRLTSGEIESVVQYLLKLNGRPHQAEAAEEGRSLYYGKADCGDCHGSDARGDSDYGSPDLTVDVWNNGGDPKSLYHSIYFGLHRIMPAWLGPLSLEQIRALAVYVYAVSHPRAVAHLRAASHAHAAVDPDAASRPGAAPLPPQRTASVDRETEAYAGVP